MPTQSIFTLAVHAERRTPTPDFTPVSPPLYTSVSYFYERFEELDAIFAGRRQGYVYGRYGNPTVAAFERAVAHLEGAEEAVAFATGMAAIHAALLAAGIHQGSHLVSAADVYGATYALQEKLFPQLGIHTHFVDITNLDQVSQVVKETKPLALICETISNPLLKVANVPALAEIAHQVGALLIVDSTFATPFLFQPLRSGADLVVHSATKYLSGHGDVMAGIVACSKERAQTLRENQKLLGANLGPQEAWLALRGLRTLALRMQQHCLNAQRVAEWLQTHPHVSKVNYPGLPGHPQHELATKLFQGRGFGGMVSFEIRGASRAEVFRFMEALKLILPATTLGDVFSLALYPAHSSHRQVPAKVRASLGISEGLVRLSIGIEDAQDIIADLNQALAAAKSN